MLSLTHHWAHHEAPGDRPGRLMLLDWPSPRVVGIVANTPWPICGRHPAEAMHQFACDFLRRQRGNPPPEDILSGLVHALEVDLSALRDAADPDDWESLWDFGGNIALAATDGSRVSVARAGDVRVVGIGYVNAVIHAENTLTAELETSGRSFEDGCASNIITAYVGGAQLPTDLVRQVDVRAVRTLVFCAFGGARRPSVESLATLCVDPRRANPAEAVLDASASQAAAHTRGVCVVEIS